MITNIDQLDDNRFITRELIVTIHATFDKTKSSATMRLHVNIKGSVLTEAKIKITHATSKQNIQTMNVLLSCNTMNKQSNQWNISHSPPLPAV